MTKNQLEEKLIEILKVFGVKDLNSKLTCLTIDVYFKLNENLISENEVEWEFIEEVITPIVGHERFQLYKLTLKPDGFSEFELIIEL